MRFHLVLTLLAVLMPAVAITSLSGCAGKMDFGNKTEEKELVIPDFPTAQEQFQFAKMFHNSQLIAPELERRRGQMNTISQYYDRVLKNFPNDPTYVPMTLLELGDCAAQSDNFDQAISYYQQAQSRSQEDFVQARAQYSIGRVYDSTSRYVEAKAIYKGIMDRYGKSQSGRVRNVVQRATKLYLQVHDKNE